MALNELLLLLLHSQQRMRWEAKGYRTYKVCSTSMDYLEYYLELPRITQNIRGFIVCNSVLSFKKVNCKFMQQFCSRCDSTASCSKVALSRLLQSSVIYCGSRFAIKQNEYAINCISLSFSLFLSVDTRLILVEKKPNRLCGPVGTGGGGCWRRVEICVTRIVTRILRGKPLIWLIWLTPQKNGSRQSTQPDWSLDWGPSLPINISAKDSRDLAFKRLTVTKNRSSNFDSFYSGRQ